jgi:hypothetical protein
MNAKVTTRSPKSTNADASITVLVLLRLPEVTPDRPPRAAGVRCFRVASAHLMQQQKYLQLPDYRAYRRAHRDEFPLVLAEGWA